MGMGTGCSTHSGGDDVVCSHTPQVGYRHSAGNDVRPQFLRKGFCFRDVDKRFSSAPRCLVPDLDGASLSAESKDALWARFFMERHDDRDDPSSDTA
jgi:hypothetical protein